MLCSIDLSTPKDLDFTLQVFGTSATNQVEARFLIVAPEFAVVCNCTQIEGGISVHIPRLEGIIPPGIHRARFEVILGDKIFVPIEDEVELVSPVKITATIANSSPVLPQVTMRMSTPAIEQAIVTTEAIKPLFIKHPVEKIEELSTVIEEKKIVSPLEKAKHKPTSEADLSLVNQMLKKKK